MELKELFHGVSVTTGGCHVQWRSPYVVLVDEGTLL